MRRLPLLLVLLLAACAAPDRGPPLVRAPESVLPPALARLQGLGEAQVLAVLGPASMARDEGPARQLQFIRPVCVLDVFLYPPAGGGAARVLSGFARRPDGSQMDPGICLGLILPAG